jgi:hypothetical protein
MHQNPKPEKLMFYFFILRNLKFVKRTHAAKIRCIFFFVDTFSYKNFFIGGRMQLEKSFLQKHDPILQKKVEIHVY